MPARQPSGQCRIERKFREHPLTEALPGDLIRRCLWAAFPGPSEHAVSLKAAIALDESPDTIKRMMRSGDGKLSRAWRILQLGHAAGVDVWWRP